MAALQWGDLPGERLAQRAPDRELERDGRRLASLRIRRQQERASRTGEYPRSGGVSPASRRPSDYVRGLGAYSTRQVHGNLARRLPRREWSCRIERSSRRGASGSSGSESGAPCSVIGAEERFGQCGAWRFERKHWEDSVLAGSGSGAARVQNRNLFLRNI